ncbi:hypothetical protein MSHI_19230 [Mycobacterium shinjukuense]|uniref:Uncharacterized protein n=1 Tax=Mycobacterium shinjukuense TaxID=398694 RepID=A0A7I7MQF8_9MYCO|nr:hypothetical protein [Mycobacterium shinjukuense]BBX74017.1 hypothetical protein MSHI_19230 [Mycobacterium shinjukuense]
MAGATEPRTSAAGPADPGATADSTGTTGRSRCIDVHTSAAGPARPAGAANTANATITASTQQPSEP